MKHKAFKASYLNFKIQFGKFFIYKLIFRKYKSSINFTVVQERFSQPNSFSFQT